MIGCDGVLPRVYDEKTVLLNRVILAHTHSRDESILLIIEKQEEKRLKRHNYISKFRFIVHFKITSN